MSVNKMMLIGNVGRDPEARKTASGDPVVSFSIATSDVWKDKASGERKERTEWHNVVCWNEQICGVLEKYVKKGSRIYVEGKSRTREYADKDGVTRRVTECVIERFQGQVDLLDRGGSDRPPAASSPDDYGKTSARDGGGQGKALVDDDIPF